MLKRITIVIPLCPVTKKNSQRIINRYIPSKGKSVPMIIPSQKYVEYEKACAVFVKPKAEIDYPVNVKCLYYMPTHRNVDLTNLMEATHDILVKHRVLKDDNMTIIQSVDGSRVLYDKDNPRTEIIIDAVEDI